MKTKKMHFLLLVMICLLFTVCSSVKIKVNMQPGVPAAAENYFTAGASKIDITPPPGYPMGGFSIAGKFSRGWWTRLYARSIYLQDQSGNRLVMVSADLWSFPAGLCDMICQVIADKEPSLRIGREQVVFAATHTHHSPANFSSSASYNTMASPDAGFDRPIFNFLVDRISDVIIQSHKNRQKAILHFHQVPLYGVSRNRSYEAFNRNPERKELLVDSASVVRYYTSDLPAFVNSIKHLQAINENLSVLKISSLDRQGNKPLAILAFFTVHPTAMGTKTEVNSGDIFAVATTHVEKKLSEYNTIVALFNGALGDIISNWKKQDRYNTLHLGQRLADAIFDAQNSADDELEGLISNAYKVISIKDEDVEESYIVENDAFCQKNPETKTSKKSVTGVAALGGAENGRTVFYDFGFREGIVKKQCTGTQGAKMFTGKKIMKDFLHMNTRDQNGKTILGWIKDYVDSQCPRKIPLGIHTLGSVTFATLPGEFTYTLGNRIKNQLKEVIPETKNVILIGPANEYLSYFTTPSEFNAQHYEGAMTMYGQFSGTYIKQELSRLPAGTANYKLKNKYNAGKKVCKKFGLIKEDDRWSMEEASQNILQDRETGAVHVCFPRVTWNDRLVHLKKELNNKTKAINPIVSIEQLGAQNTYLLLESDPASLNFVNYIDAVCGDTARWCSIWLGNSEVDSTQALRFKIELPSEIILYSNDFYLKDYAVRFPNPPPIEIKNQ